MARSLHMAVEKLSSEESPSATTVQWHKPALLYCLQGHWVGRELCEVRSSGSPRRITKEFIFPLRADTQFSPTKNNKDAQHSDLRRQLLPPAHEPDMLQSGHGSSAGRALTVCKCTSTVGCRGGQANEIPGRDKREDFDQYPREGRFCSAVREQQDQR